MRHCGAKKERPETSLMHSGLPQSDLVLDQYTVTRLFWLYDVNLNLNLISDA